MPRDGQPLPFTPLSFAAGSLAGATGALFGHPLDTLKVYSQIGLSSKELFKPALWRTIPMFYRGVTLPLMTSGGIQAINFGIFQNGVRVLQTRVNGRPAHEPPPLWVAGVSASLTGVLISVLTAPQQRVKILQQVSGTSLVDTVRPLLLRPRLLFTGWGLQAVAESGRGVYIMTYISLVRYFDPVPLSGAGIADSGGATELRKRRTVGGASGSSAPWWAKVISGATAGVVGWTVIYPLDVIKSVVQAQPIASPRASSLHCAQMLLKEGGVARLYRGLGYTLIRGGPVAGVVLPCYDVSLALLQRNFPSLA